MTASISTVSHDGVDVDAVLDELGEVDTIQDRVKVDSCRHSVDVDPGRDGIEVDVGNQHVDVQVLPDQVRER